MDEERPTLVVASEVDPVARIVVERWQGAEPTGDHLDGASVRRLDDGVLVVRRPGRHLDDDGLDRRLPPSLASRRPTLVFPSVHRSGTGQRCFTVHPLGNPGGTSELGGRPRSLVPTDPCRMVSVLRGLQERGAAVGLPATYEATHHGPLLGLPAFFVEVAVQGDRAPSASEVAVVASAIEGARPASGERVALAVGGGHYAPRFTDLAMGRRFAFGHILSRHALVDLAPATARQAYEGTLGATGVLYARAQDRGHPALAGLGPELKETDAPRRERPTTSTSSPTSGT